MILTGVPMGAQEAMQRGLVSKVFPVDQESDYCSSFWEMILICKLYLSTISKWKLEKSFTKCWLVEWHWSDPSAVGGRGGQDGWHHCGAVQDVDEDGQGGDERGVRTQYLINIMRLNYQLPETHYLVAAQIFPTAQIFLELNFILEIKKKIAKQPSIWQSFGSSFSTVQNEQ